MKKSATIYAVVLAAGLVFGGATAASGAVYTEDFESGFTSGQRVGTHADWYDDGTAPVCVNSGIGVAGSVGLDNGSSGSRPFTWTAHPFHWNAPGFPGTIVVQMDFETGKGTGAAATASSNYFDDDRCVWSISDSSTSSSNLFGAQLDHWHGGWLATGGIYTYWTNSGGTRIRDLIVALTGLKENTWYRFRNEITKLTATSARLDVSLIELDASGNPTGTPTTGIVVDTSTLGDRAPADYLFAASSMWPSYKNYNGLGYEIEGGADNAYFALVPEPSALGLLAVGSVGIMLKRRSR